MEGKTNFSRRLKQFAVLTWLTLTARFYDGADGAIAHSDFALAPPG